MATEAQCRLAERLAKGESVAGIPKVVAKVGETVTLEFDAIEAEKAILAH
jgi:hypothetical protein